MFIKILKRNFYVDFEINCFLLTDVGTCDRFDLHRYLYFRHFCHNYFGRHAYNARLLAINCSPSDWTCDQHSGGDGATLSLAGAFSSNIDNYSKFVAEIEKTNNKFKLFNKSKFYKSCFRNKSIKAGKSWIIISDMYSFWLYSFWANLYKNWNRKSQLVETKLIKKVLKSTKKFLFKKYYFKKELLF